MTIDQKSTSLNLVQICWWQLHHVWLIVSLIQYEYTIGQNDSEISLNLEICRSERAHAQMYNISSHIVENTWENNVEQHCISIETDLFVGCEHSWWINGICDLGTDFSLPPCLIGSRHRVGCKRGHVCFSSHSRHYISLQCRCTSQCTHLEGWLYLTTVLFWNVRRPFDDNGLIVR